MNNVASRGASLALLLLVALVASTGPALARAAPSASTPAPTHTPIFFPMTPPTPRPGSSPGPVATAQAALMAPAACQNDQFLALRTVPMPQQGDVSVCGLVSAGTATGTAGFLVSIDGTQPIPVSGAGTVNVHPGDSVLVRGRYRRDKSGTERIDAAGSGAVSLLGAASPVPGG